MVHELKQRGLLPWAKTVTYCMMHFVVAVAVAYAISRNWAIALGIGVIEPLVQTVAYHFHERAWDEKAEQGDIIC